MAGMPLDYIDVAARIAEFRTKHPEGCFQPADLSNPYRVETIGNETYIVVVAAAYRTPDDVRPGIGMAYEVFPGKTNFTRGSELQNAETSAWGRAIVAVLAADTKKGIASAEEVRNRREEQAAPRQVPEQRKSPADQVKDQMKKWAESNGYSLQDVVDRFAAENNSHIKDEDNAGILSVFFAAWQKEHAARAGAAA